jgi:two-component system phosphate regulon response regulator PhoB
LILLDLMLPGIGGLDVCRLLRSDEETRNTPIIVLTARSEEVDVVAGLEVGADDYVTKPFSPRILMARVRTVLRRRVSGEDAEASVIQAGDLSMDLGKHQVNLAGKPVVLTPTEFALLLILARRPGWVFSRSQLIDSLHDGQYVITDRAIDVQVANLRKKLGEWGGLIETVRGAGYRLRENS